jgi:hypothetical protein
MKYIFLQLKIRNGEYEYYSHNAISVSVDTDQEEYAEEFAKSFYNGEPDIDDKTYYFNGMCVAVQVHSVKVITASEYEVLNNLGLAIADPFYGK